MTRFEQLLEGYLSARLEPAELKEFLSLVGSQEEQLTAVMQSLLASGQFAGGGDAAAEERIYAGLRGRMELDKPVRQIGFRWGWVAAAAVLLALGMYFLALQRSPAPVPAQTADIAPGKEGAILTLADGSRVSLDSAANGVVAMQGGAAATVANGALVYEGKGSEVVYNTMSTPKGRQFQLTLPDGTKVWLNAASAIRYPTAFKGSERKVEVTGEAYFEVAENAGQPFRVSVRNKTDVIVLGTQFNINAYDNEPSITTTLLEGSVKAGGVLLKPGQQAQTAGGQTKTIANVNIEKAIAWKNGFFNFEGAKLEEAMRQLERWYNIEVVYEHGVPDIEFGGALTRDISLKALLNALEKSKVHFRLEEGNRLVVIQ